MCAHVLFTICGLFTISYGLYLIQALVASTISVQYLYDWVPRMHTELKQTWISLTKLALFICASFFHNFRTNCSISDETGVQRRTFLKCFVELILIVVSHFNEIFSRFLASHLV